MNSLYVPLRNFTKYTISESILDIKPWLVKLAQHKIPAAVCTDKNNLFSMVQFYKTAISLKIKPIFGVHFLVQVPGSSKRLDCLFLAKNNNGYIQLSSIISDYYKKTNADRSFDVSILKNQSSDLMLIVDQESIDLLGQQLSFWKSLFDNRIFIGLQRYPEHKESYAHSYQALRFCQEHAIVPVAANSVFFLNEEDFETQQIKVCIQNAEYYDDARRVIHHHKHQYFLNPEVMSTLFSDCLHVLKNTITLAEKCTVHLNFGQILLPQFSNDEQSMLFTLAQEGLLERKKMNTAIENDFNKYHDRLVFELKMICQMGFSGYFLIVSDFIRWAKNNLIPVGPGRGSGAGSLVAYVLKITDLDPLQYDLLFERFLNPERVSMPDFDVDFCMEKRDAVIQYVQKRYGIESVSQIATFGTMAAKAVIRDVGRVLNHPFPFVDKLAKMIPLQIGITLSDALEKNELLKKAYQDDEVVTQLIDYALKLEGLPRNIGKHAGGVVIAPRDLKTICPLYNEPDAHWHPITQLDKDDVESIGLIKFDFLGLKTLTVIDWTYQYCHRLGLVLPALEELSLTDNRSYQTLLKGKTVAVFQLESRGMRDLILRLKPDCFEDIIALVALFRPGPLQSGMVDDFIDRKHGRSTTLYPHPLSEPVLKATYGVILYQEQVMQLAQVLAGYTLGGADLLRRAMGKKKPEEMAQQRTFFVQGAIERDIEEGVASFIFDLIEKFAGYGFNKSHSAAYALIAFQTLYLKTHVPAAFMAANMTAEEGNLDKILILIEDAKDLNIEIHPPCINQSELNFRPLSSTAIAFGLGSIKGIGQAILSLVIKNREEKGLFLSFENFIARVSPLGLPKKSIELLIKVGAFDRLNAHRKSLIDQYLPKFFAKWDKNHATQQSLFDYEDMSDMAIIEDYLWSDKINLEINLVGFALSGSLVDPYLSVKQSLWQKSYHPQEKKPALAVIAGIREILTSKNTKFTIVQLVCSQVLVEIILNPLKERDQHLIKELNQFVEEKKPVIVSLKQTEGRNKKIFNSLVSLSSIENFLKNNVKMLTLEIDIDVQSPDILFFLKTLPDKRYDCQLQIILKNRADHTAVTFEVEPNTMIHGELSILIERAYVFKAYFELLLT